MFWFAILIGWVSPYYYCPNAVLVLLYTAVMSLIIGVGACLGRNDSIIKFL